MDPHLTAGIVIAFALAFTFTNGMNDAANAIATVVCTRVMSPASAVLYGAVLNFIGALVSVEVAKTITSIAPISMVTPAALIAAVIASPIWILWCTLKGFPISCSHSLLGAIIGGIVATVGSSNLNPKVLWKMGYGIFASPIAGFLIAILMIAAISWICRRTRPGTVNSIFGKLQILSAGAMAYSHGTGDGQKAIGIITAALMVTGLQDPKAEFHVQWWVKLTCAVVMGLGTGIGGWTVVKTLGSRLAHLKTYQGFAAETAASVTILLNTSFGIPISTTHSITGAIMGVGAARGMRRVRWGVGRKIVFAWIFTFPVCMIGSAVTVKILHLFGMK